MVLKHIQPTIAVVDDKVAGIWWRYELYTAAANINNALSKKGIAAAADSVFLSF